MDTDITTDRGDENMLRQVAPYPHELRKLVDGLRYRRHLGWKVELHDDYVRDPADTHGGETRGMTLVVTRCGPDTYDHETTLKVRHLFEVPAATYNQQSWMMWLFERLSSVDRHEAMEDFAFENEAIAPYAESLDGMYRPIPPCHGPGWDPYLITVERTETDRRTSFRGDVSPV